MKPFIPFWVSFLPLGAMIWSDFRHRQIHLYGLILFSILQLISAYLIIGGSAVAIHLILNLAFLALLYFLLWLYVRLLRRRAYTSLGAAIGLGDLLFLPALSPLFPIRDFILFLTFSFILTLVAWSVLSLFRRKQQSIPLVGCVGCFFIICSLFVRFF